MLLLLRMHVASLKWFSFYCECRLCMLNQQHHNSWQHVTASACCVATCVPTMLVLICAQHAALFDLLQARSRL
jgi:hypothetical protein